MLGKLRILGYSCLAMTSQALHPGPAPQGHPAEVTAPLVARASHWFGDPPGRIHLAGTRFGQVADELVVTIDQAPVPFQLEPGGQITFTLAAPATEHTRLEVWVRGQRAELGLAVNLESPDWEPGPAQTWDLSSLADPSEAPAEHESPRPQPAPRFPEAPATPPPQAHLWDWIEPPSPPDWHLPVLDLDEALAPMSPAMPDLAMEEVAPGMASTHLVSGPLVMDLATHHATFYGRPLALAPEEFRPLSLLAGHAGRPMPRRQLRKALGDLGYHTSLPRLVKALGSLGRKLEASHPHRRHLLNLASQGFLWEPEPAAEPAAPAPGLTLAQYGAWAQVDGRPVALTPPEALVVELLLARKERFLTQAQYKRQLQANGETLSSPALRRRLMAVIGTLRRKLEVDPRHPRRLLGNPATGYTLLLD